MAEQYRQIQLRLPHHLAQMTAHAFNDIQNNARELLADAAH
jgi:hypothetical protein